MNDWLSAVSGQRDSSLSKFAQEDTSNFAVSHHTGHAVSENTAFINFPAKRDCIGYGFNG
jgi:hypothetical protein